MPMMKLASLLLLPALVSAKAILGVDLGSLYMKVALVQRGAPLEIVTNLHSKRKTENMILFDASSRFFGADADSLYARKPKQIPSSMSVLLGRHDEHPSVTVLAERHYPILPKYNETRAGLTMTVAGQEFTPEELVAMVLSHARDMTLAYAEENGNSNVLPKDLVLTVPSYATQHERKALMDAATLADFNVLSLIDETTAAALHYGMDKIMEEPKILIFYNLGASSLQVNVVRFLSYQHKESKLSKGKTVGGLEVLGKAWDATLGGLALDHRIVEYLADEFNAKWGGGDVRKFPRPMAKLRVQANKVKHVLSANTEIPIYMDALHEDISLQTSITRAKLEELCADLLERAVKPIDDALKRANVTMDQVDGIELIGGGMRVPKIQEYIKGYLGEAMELGLHINSDESMALGAAFHGANISTAFKVRHVGMSDINPFPVKISLKEIEPVENAEESWTKEAIMFKSGGKVGVKKTIAFSHNKDVQCDVDYEESDLLPSGTQLSLERYNITGITHFAEEMKKKELGIPKVSLQFELSNSGISRLVKAEAAVEETYTVIEEEEVDDDETEEKKEDDKEEKVEKKDEDSENETKKEEQLKKKKTIQVEKEKKKLHKRTLTVTSYHVGRVQPYTPEIMAESKAKMQELARKDKERQMMEMSRNNVESFIYKIKNKLVDDEENVKKVSTEQQRDDLLKLATDAEEWLYEDGYTADFATMEDKYAELATPADKLFFRVAELTALPEAIKTFKEKLEKIEKLMTKWETTHPHINEAERSAVLSKVEDAKTWLADKEKEQSEVAPSDDPILISSELAEKSKPIEILVSRLSKKPKPKPKKNETKTENETKAENETKTDNETKAENETITLTEEAELPEKDEAEDADVSTDAESQAESSESSEKDIPIKEEL